MSTLHTPETNAIAACVAFVAWQNHVRELPGAMTDEISRGYFRDCASLAKLSCKQIVAEGRGEWLQGLLPAKGKS